ncbi:MAG: hypothetical protein HC876_20355, partial [Chloroflexaceae bacterium]|nr:hypothetical protein [Chloroflexaceae bacterium]
RPRRTGTSALCIISCQHAAPAGTAACPQSSDVPGEGHQPPLAYLLYLPAVAWLAPTEHALLLTSNPAFVWNGGTEHAAFVRGSNQYFPWQGIVLAWHLARGISALLGAVTVLCTWGAARLLVPGNRTLPLLAAALVAFNPQFLFISALVTNDALLITLCAGVVWLGIALLRHTTPPTRSAAVWLGVLCGLALLTKLSGLILLPVAALVLWLAGGHRLQNLGIWAAVVALLAGWWYLRNWHLYGDPLGLDAFQSTYATQPFDWHRLAAWQGGLWQLYRSTWAFFGWISLPAPLWGYGVYGMLVLLALVGLLMRGISWPDLRPMLPALALVGLALAWVVSFALVAGLVAWQGRLLFPALPALALLLAVGYAQWIPDSQQQAALAGGIALVLAGLALYLPVAVIAPAYQWHTLPPAVAQQRITQPVYARYAAVWEQGIELHGWRLSREGVPVPTSTPVQAGQAISVTLTWHALERVPQDWTVFLHLVTSEGDIVAEHNSRPQLGQFPMLLWTPGDWLEDSHPLLLPADLPPGAYTLRVGLYRPWQRDPRRGERQPVWGADGSTIGDLAEVGLLRVE